MQEIVKADQAFERHELPAAEAAAFFADEPYKAEIIERVTSGAGSGEDAGEIGGGDSISYYSNGDGFRDMCTGPHVPSTGRLARSSFSRSPVRTGEATSPVRCCSASTARRGPTKALKTHLQMLAEAEKRDHRRRHRARPRVVARRTRSRTRRVAPQGRADPQDHGGLQPTVTKTVGTSSCSRRTSRSRCCGRPQATSTSTPTACTRPWRWMARRTTRSR